MRIVLFDLMDTLVIDPYHRVFEGVLAGPARRSFLRWINQSAFEQFERGEISEHEYFRVYYNSGLPDEERRLLPRPEKIKKQMFKYIKFTPGIDRIVKTLASRPDVRLGVASNYSEWYTEALARRGEIEELFDYLFFSCEMGTRKPAEDFYRIIFTALGRDWPELQEEDVIFIDDRECNLAPARARGWRTCLCTSADAVQSALADFLGDADWLPDRTTSEPSRDTASEPSRETTDDARRETTDEPRRDTANEARRETTSEPRALNKETT